MEIRPILSTLSRHKLIASLLALLVALTCGIVCNVAFMIQQHTAQFRLSSGVAENEVVMIQGIDLVPGVNQVERHRADLDALRAIPGITSAAAVDSLPLGVNNDSEGTCNSSAAAEGNSLGNSCVVSSVYDGTPGVLKTLGLRLVAGRDFRPDEFMHADASGDPAVAIITHALAEKLYPDGGALGKTLYTDPGRPIRVIGIVADTLRPYLQDTVQKSYYSMIWPVVPDGPSVTYLMRTASRERARVLKDAEKVLYRIESNRVVRKPQTFQQLRAGYFQNDRTMIRLLLASAFGLLFVAALGITGLANFWVQQRTRSIGIRRAVGATRGDILRYFQTENLLIVTGGIVLGVILAVGLNLLLMKYYELPRLPWWYLPVGAVALWLLGQLAVLAPALRASHVPPVVATRSV